MKNLTLPTWRHSNGEILACTEKIKVMRENLADLIQVLQDSFEDGILMGIDENQIRQVFINLVNQLENPYKERNV